MADYSEATLIPAYGMYAEPYATVYPDLSDSLATMYANQVALINWLPANWLSNVMALHGQNGEILIPAPAGVTPPIPWLDTADKIAWWNQFNQMAEAAIQAYAADQAAQGALLMQQAADDIAFWDEAYNIATVAALPVTVAKGALNVVADIGKGVNALGGSTNTFLVIGGLAALGAYLYFKKK